MMSQYLLTLLIFVPVAAALALLLLPSSYQSYHKWIALGVSAVQVMLLLAVFGQYDPSGGFQLEERARWIDLSLGTGKLTVEYLLAIDGLSLPLVALSVFVLLVAVISSWNVTDRSKGYFALLLILNGAVIGSFCALDLLLFYLFFEFMLLPMYFLIGIWGGPRREYASIKFFLYTLLGSILILLVLIGLYISSDPKTFVLTELLQSENIASYSVFSPADSWMILGWPARNWAFLFLLIGFGIKLPMVPLHTWLPDAHVEASTPISVVLAALLLKIGAYGLLRMAYPLFPDAANAMSVAVAVLGMLSIVYGAMNALASKDFKRLIAYSSVSHMGFVLLGLASATVEGITGAVFQMTSHGLISAMLFLIAGVLYDRTHDRTIANYSGLASRMPVYTSFVLVAFFATLGLPGLSGFIGEIMVFLGAFRSGLIPGWISIVSTTGLIFGAGYCLWTIQRMFFGPYAVRDNIPMHDVVLREKIMLLPLAMLIITLGIFPQTVIRYINPFSVWLSEILTEGF
ncbi:MAG TPA: NADH-quinone oxidoreductase subunit M [Cyclobacteriaceae bacterium]|nr:NADH-quinone oxidoreductase subunit M [Cyclobacteriaceae bacterium]